MKDHRLGIALTVVFGMAGILASLLSQDIRIAIGLEKPRPGVEKGSSTPSPETGVVSTPFVNDSRTPPASPKTEASNSPRPSPLSDDQSVSPIVSPTVQQARPVATRPTKIDNDVGKSKTNDFYEVTVENARASRDRVSFGICNFNVPSEQKAMLVRFTIRLLTPPRTYEESQRLANPHITDFVLMDDQNRKLDPRCQDNGTNDIYLNSFLNSNSGNATTLTLAYLVPTGSEHISFRFQKSGAGRPIVFDLSGLN